MAPLRFVDASVMLHAELDGIAVVSMLQTLFDVMRHNSEPEVGVIVAAAANHTWHETTTGLTTTAFRAEGAAELSDANAARYDG